MYTARNKNNKHVKQPCEQYVFKANVIDHLLLEEGGGLL